MTAELSRARRLWAMLAISLGTFVAVMHLNVITVALPTIAEDLGVDSSSAVWVVVATQLAITASLFPFAALGERIGYPPVYYGGLLVCALTSLACGYSQTLGQLVASRAIQGFAISAVLAVNLATVRFIFPSNKLGIAIGYVSSVVAVSSTLGPTIAGAILSAASWHWLFLLNVPAALVAALIAMVVLPATPKTQRGFDTVGALLSAVTFAVLVLALDSAGRGRALAVPLLLGLGGGALIYVLIRHQARHPNPMLPLDLFRLSLLRLSMMTAVFSHLAQGVSFVALPFYFHDVLKMSPQWVGLAMAPWPLGIALAAPIAGWLTARYSAGVLSTLGLATLAGGHVLLLFVPADATVYDILWRMLICGIGFGFFQTPNNVTIMGSVPAERAASAGAIQSAGRLFGQTFGVTIAALILGIGANATTIAILASATFASIGALFSVMRGASKIRPS